ncbi:Gfo/Idh/MocA family protein [Paenibacillus daejeonensis]|uniref:Gfo/Idh/MocA family protein n=1 Tax=Paenibacillus daejeonensis TaxID=135193 RepID=UPI000374FC71|nr:Gfo/Idh/MocA family oxidoreductase [Paenibacillus daejeonensis]
MTLKLCTIGGSGHLAYVLRDLPRLPEVEWVGYAPGDEEEREETLAKTASLAKSAGLEVPRFFENWREMLDTQQPDVAAVDSHFARHATIGIETLRRGIHLFLEKPLATEREQLQELRLAYDASGVQLAAMHGLRYAPAFHAAWEAVQAGAIGRIKLMHAQKSYRLGERPAIYRSRDTYGGTIPWVGSHAVDWLLWFAGTEFRSVYAVHSSQDNAGHGDLEMTALCQFRMGGDIQASVSLDYLRPAGAPSHADDRIRIAGTAGIVEVRDGQALLIEADSDGIHTLAPKPQPGIFEDFVRQLRTGESCRISAEESFAVTEACLLARTSADTGQAISFPSQA